MSHSKKQDDEKAEGGFKGELGRAASKMVAAMKSGDPELLAVAMSDHAAALGSQATEAMAAMILRLMDRFDQLNGRLDRRDKSDMDWRVELRIQLEDISIAYNKEMDNVLATLKEGVASTKKLQGQMDALAGESNSRWEHTLEFEVQSSADRQQLHQGQDRLKNQITDLSGVVTELKNEMGRYMEGSRRAELDSIIERLTNIEHTFKKSED